MSYDGVSIREAMEKLNALNNGWFLPQVQRQYVWGARHESEHYVCLLLDSLWRRFPIGGVVLWETSKPVPFREFVRDYAPGRFAHQVEEGRWGAAKSLVYDGQQRLQTLYSVLYHSFHGRVLHFDLYFDQQMAEADETGFLFRDADAPTDARYLKLTSVMHLTCNPDTRVALEDEKQEALKPEEARRRLIRRNLGAIWEIFVDTNIKSIAYFSVKADTPAVVNEVFRRLNTGGVALTELELVLSDIKAVQSDYEEDLWALSERIVKQSGGIVFSSASILQFFYLLVKGTTSIKASSLTADDVVEFQKVLKQDADALVEVFEGYLNGQFKINHASIVPRWLAVLPIAAYVAARSRAKHEWRIKALPTTELDLINRYFILSQFCDWNTQTMINPFSRLALEAGTKGDPFPLAEISRVAVQKNRTDILHYHQFLAIPWLATKILTPSRTYVFHENKPQVDHIFPLNMTGADEAYRDRVDVLWNFQPMPAGVNNYKRARHPKEFFNSADGAKYWGDYDFVPPAGSAVWDNYKLFVWSRHRKMRQALFDRYALKLKRSRETK
jgi:hypothetical protein